MNPSVRTAWTIESPDTPITINQNFKVVATTNVAAPMNTWLNLGPAMEAPPGTFQFTEPDTTNYPQHFYRVE